MTLEFRLKRAFRRCSKDERGTIAIMFALLLVPLLLFTGGAIDFSRYNAVRADLVESLDAAGLAMAQLDEANPPQISSLTGSARDTYLKNWGRDFFHENFRSDGLIENLTIDFTLTPTTITPTASGVLKTVILRAAGPLVGGDALAQFDISSNTEITRRGSGNIELAMLLDTTSSMGSGTKMADLIAAARALIQIVVRTEQTPFYSKVALVPYGASVNLGSNAATVRGAVTAGRAVTGASWANGSAIGINGITRANPAVVTTASNHGYNNGDVVWISGVSGMTQVNNRAYTVANRTANTFQLSGTNSSSWSNYSSSSSDTTTRCQVAQCLLVFTANDHGFANGAHVFISGVGGLSLTSAGTSAGAQAINNTPWSRSSWQVANATTNTFTLSSHANWNNPALGPYYNAFSANGTAYCTVAGCQYYRFTNGDGNIRVNPISTCVAERTGGNAYTDASYTTTALSRTYPPSHHCYANNVITPLSSDRADLDAKVGLLSATGPSGGHVGVAWGWYVLSPNFASLFPTASQAAAYTAPNVQKVVVLMTDGEYNSSYCNGVVSNVTSTTGSGSSSDKINCAAPNGHSYAQSQALCAAMKTAGVVVYTVGFDVVNNQDARDLINNCATSSRHVYMAATGAELEATFRTIAREVSELRVSR